MHRSVFCSGSGPDGRVTRKDIESFVPPKAAPVSESHCLVNRRPIGNAYLILSVMLPPLVCDINRFSVYL